MMVSIRMATRNASHTFELTEFNDRYNQSWGCSFVPLDNTRYLEMLDWHGENPSIMVGRIIQMGVYGVNYRLIENGASEDLKG